MLKFLETKDWETSFLHVIPTRKGAEKKDPSIAEDLEKEAIVVNLKNS